MRLATLNDGTRDGTLVVIHRSGDHFISAKDIASSLQDALDRWDDTEPKLRRRAQDLDEGIGPVLPLDPNRLLAPLPRAYEWIDGSAYINHIVLVRRARGATPPETLRTSPLVYQGGSSEFLAPRADIPLQSDELGLDFEAEICVVLGDTPRGTKASEASDYVRLVMLCNDITLRNLIPEELAKGFGFFNSKPATAFSPFALTPDELGDAWDGSRLQLTLRTELNGEVVGNTDAGPEMHFGFGELLEHVCQTRSFTAGTILGSGTVSNEDPEAGVSCLSERRMREIIESGIASTDYLKEGDRVRISMEDHSGRDLFGAIDQQVARA